MPAPSAAPTPSTIGEADWDAVVDLDLKSLFFLSQAFGRAVLAAGRQGRIVNIASVLSFQGGIRVPAYTAAKHGVLGVTRALACEWAARGVNVNAIAPGYVISDNTEALRADPERSSAILARIPGRALGRAGRHRRRRGLPSGARLALHARRRGAGRRRLAGTLTQELPMATSSPRSADRPWTEIGPGNRRRVLVRLPELMMVEFAFEEGAVGAPHSHPHVQASYVAQAVSR